MKSDVFILNTLPIPLSVIRETDRWFYFVVSLKYKILETEFLGLHAVS